MHNYLVITLGIEYILVELTVILRRIPNVHCSLSLGVLEIPPHYNVAFIAQLCFSLRNFCWSFLNLLVFQKLIAAAAGT